MTNDRSDPNGIDPPEPKARPAWVTPEFVELKIWSDTESKGATTADGGTIKPAS
jgi:hypothetical protein